MTEFMWVAIGETLLAATFALGILVGATLQRRKDLQHDSDSD